MLVQVCHQSHDKHMHKKDWKQVENQFFKNKEGLELQRGKKQGVVTQQSHIQLHDTIPISLSVISMGHAMALVLGCQ